MANLLRTCPGVDGAARVAVHGTLRAYRGRGRQLHELSYLLTQGSCIGYRHPERVHCVQQLRMTFLHLVVLLYWYVIHGFRPRNLWINGT